MNIKRRKVTIKVPTWVKVTYPLLSVVLVPWTIYLSITLPTRHLSRNWDVSWVGLDIAILLTLLATGIFATVKSRWISISATMAATLLLVDAWFDVISERPGLELDQAIILAVFFEIPLAIISLHIALNTLSKNID